MKTSLFIAIAIFTTASVVLAQNRDQPSPQPGFGAGGGAPGFPVVPVPGQPGLGGGFPGGGGVAGGFPGGGMPGGMGGGMGMPGLGFSDIPNRFQLFTGEVIPEGKDKPLPMILKIDTQTGQVWQLQVEAQNKVRFVLIEGQPGRFNGPQRGFGGHPGGQPGAGGLPLNPRPPAPQTFPGRPTQPSPRPEPR
jgi:hypothetical protein